METTASKIATMLNAESFGASNITVYMNHLIVQVEASCPAEQAKKVKSVIALLIDEHFPLRTEDIPFLLKRDARPDESFILYKPKRFTKLNGSTPLENPDCNSTTVSS